MSTVLYTSGILDKLVISAATSEAAGHPIENAFDFNPDTYWSPTSTANQTIDIDLGEAKGVDAFAIFIRNYDTDYDSGTQAIGLASDDNDNGAYSATTYLGGSAALFDNTVGQPIWIVQTAGSVVTKRYWRIVIANMTAIAQIAAFLPLRKRDLGISHQWPENDDDIYHNRQIVGEGGRTFVKAINGNIQNVLRRTYLFSGSTAWSSQPLKLALDDCRGSRFPLILSEDNGSLLLVRFGSDALGKNQIDYRIFNPTVEFVSMPYIGDGAGY